MTARNRAEFGAAFCAFVVAATLAGGTQADASSRGLPKATYFTVVVRPGDTLFAIAERYAASSSEIASLNRLPAGGHVRAGEVLRVPASGDATREAVLAEASDSRVRNYAPAPRPIDTERFDAARVAVHALFPPAAPSPRPQRVADVNIDHEPAIVTAATRGPHASGQFAWPLEGQVISPFGNLGKGERNDGINIAAETGTPIHAAASGRVTYAGHELKGYGNLVLIEHDDGYVTAYAHAESISVGRGDRVEKGQVIGLAGDTGDVDRPQLHFEIRKGKQPVNPRLLLAAN